MPGDRLPPYARPDGSGILLSVKVQPRASRNEVAGMAGTLLRIRLTAPPVDSAANQALVHFLAEKLGLSRSQVVLVRGLASRQKTVRLSVVPAPGAFEHLAP